MAIPMPTYIGLRTQRYGPLTTSRRGGSNGAGVPRPRQAKARTQGTPITVPMATTIQPRGCGSSNAREPANHRGRKESQSETKSGATIRDRLRAKIRRVMADDEFTL